MAWRDGAREIGFGANGKGGWFGHADRVTNKGRVSGQEFSEELDTYVVLLLRLQDYGTRPRALPDGFEFVGAERRKALRGQERKILREKFEDWDIPYCAKLRGWRADSPIYVVRGDELVGGAYLCDKNEFDDNPARGQLHYMFVRNSVRGQGIYSVLFRQVVDRAKAWGLDEILINTDRYLLPQVHMRWGAKVWKEIKKPSRLPYNALGKVVRAVRHRFRGITQLWSNPCE